MVVQSLNDVTQDESGYRIHFSDAVIGVEQYDDITAYARDVIERNAVEFLRAVLVLHWVNTGHVGESVTISDTGAVTFNG